jgi:hypothetical protein
MSLGSDWPMRYRWRYPIWIRRAQRSEFSERYRFHYFACEPDIVLFEGVRELLQEQHQLRTAVGGRDRQEPARSGAGL